VKPPTLVLVSNRGPLSWRHDGDRLVARRGGGGLVSGLAPLVEGSDARWLASALSPADAEAAALGLTEAEGLRVELVDHGADVLRDAYEVVGNSLLWYLHHGLFDLARRPSFDAAFRQTWAGFRAYNQNFADAIVATAPADSVVLAQDYHLSLLAPLVRARRDDLRIVHFAHTPFAGPELLRVLPDPYRHELLVSLASSTACAFHTARWRDAFASSCATFGIETPPLAVTPLGPDPADLEAVATGAACREAGAELDDLVGDRRLIVRVDRIELSKNLLRGFHAYDEMLAQYPQWRGRVCFAAFVYPSRETLADYAAYREETDRLVAAINDRWATPEWTPILADASDDFPRSVAALQRYDALLVNPIRDGMNLVAKEGPLVNRRDGVVVLSTEAGAWDELGAHALGVHPFDVGATADALRRALEMPEPERRERAAALRQLVTARTPADWLADQLAAAAAS